MRSPKTIAFMLLALYSIWLIALEIRTSQAQARPYFADIEGEIALFAVNTTLSASLLGGAALLMLFAGVASHTHCERGRAFLLSQSGFFFLLAFDDRFQLHERIGWRLGVGDHYVLAAWALTEVGILAVFCRPAALSRRATTLFLAGSIFFTVMFVIDAFAPAGAVLRLSVEDLAKTWGAAMFFGFGWEAARLHLQPALPPAAAMRGAIDGSPIAERPTSPKAADIHLVEARP